MKVKNGNKPRVDLKNLRIKEANERLERWTSLSVSQKLNELNHRMGASKKQKQKLESLLAKGKENNTSTKVNEVTKKVEIKLKAKDRRTIEQSKNKNKN